VKVLGFVSPFATAHALTIDRQVLGTTYTPADWRMFATFLGFYTLGNAALVVGMLRLFNTRWRVSE
jgi:hypothetical protein